MKKVEKVSTLSDAMGINLKSSFPNSIWWPDRKGKCWNLALHLTYGKTEETYANKDYLSLDIPSK